MKIPFFLTLLILLCAAAFHGCCPSKDKVLREIITEYQNKYITEYDTVYTPEIYRDTLLRIDSIPFEKPVIIERDKLRVQVLRLKGDTIKISGQCKPDTVEIERQVITVRQAEEPETRWWQWIVYALAALGTLVMGAAIVRIIKR